MLIQQDFLIYKSFLQWIDTKRYRTSRKIPDAKVETGKQFYYSNAGKNEVIQIFSYNKNEAKQATIN